MFRWPGEKWVDNKPEIIWNIKKKRENVNFFSRKHKEEITSPVSQMQRRATKMKTS